jgi:serine/threonine-protein kinase ULK/ATG1
MSLVNALRKVTNPLFRPPYLAGNMVDLLNMIRTKPLKFPHIPKLNDTLMDVMKRMLVADPKKRIGWSELFSHPINTYLDRQLKK